MLTFNPLIVVLFRLVVENDGAKNFRVLCLPALALMLTREKFSFGKWPVVASLYVLVVVACVVALSSGTVVVCGGCLRLLWSLMVGGGG